MHRRQESIWNNNHRFGPFTVSGHSRGSERTGFYIKELNAFLDAGVQSYYEPHYVLITHCHTDHSFALPMLLTGINTKPTVYCPAESVQYFNNFCDATRQLSKHTKSVKNEYPIVGLYPGDSIPLKGNYYAAVYNLYHNAPCRGYGIYERRNKLRPDLQGASKEQIMAAKRENSITVPVNVPILAYLCDTTIEVLRGPNAKEILTFPHIMIECTFLYDEAPDASHIRWSELKPYVVANPQTTFVLIHFSFRYTDEEIREFFQKESLSNVIALY